jgi:hypothetical protein
MKKLFIALLTAFTMSSAFAGATERCTHLSNFAFSVATARNTGVEQGTLQTQVFNLIDEGKIKQFVSFDKIELGRIITILYNHPSATPQYAAQSYFQHCMQTTQDV